MNESITISKNAPVERSMNYNFLRTTGLKYIEKLAGKIWTDYNNHDPGITMLEVLCYAITDLGYRTTFSVEDILASEENNFKTMHEQFYSAKHILPTRPITAQDYRKLFIDIPGVKNAWTAKANQSLIIDCDDEKFVSKKSEKRKQQYLSLNGLYDFLIEIDTDSSLTEAEKKHTTEKLIEECKHSYHQNRNLCEDINSISVVETQGVIICTDVEIAAGADVETIYAQILAALENYLSPPVNRYSLEQMLQKRNSYNRQYTVDEVFNGPLLIHGFIDDDELENSGLREVIYASDIINILMDIPGVAAIKKIMLNYCQSLENDEKHYWCLHIEKNKKPKLCRDKTSINFYVDGIPVKINETEANLVLSNILKRQYASRNEIHTSDYNFKFGEYYDIENYYSITHHLPDTYGVNDSGISANASVKRRSEAKQLKAFLFLFDQILANYLAQLRHVGQLFTMYPASKKTYFSQAITEVNGIEELYADYDNITIRVETITAKSDNYIERRGRFLDHLLARFSETFTNYAMQNFSLNELDEENAGINLKEIFLQEYVTISKNKSAGFDYFNTEDATGNPIASWNTLNVSGLEHRIARLLGFADYKRKYLSLGHADVYDEKDNDGIKEYRFRLIDSDTDEILLSSSTHYYSKSACEQEFNTSVALAMSKTNYQLRKTVNGKFYFNISNADGVITARRIEYFDTDEQRNAAIEYLIHYLKTHFSDEGIFIVEHILLRPETTWLDKPNPSDPYFFMPIANQSDCEHNCVEDPYSFHVTVIIPANMQRFKNMDFRTYAEKLIRTETPAHILPKICWVNTDDLKVFEDVFMKWIQLKQEGKMNSMEGKQAVTDLNKILFSVKSVYPTGNLFYPKNSNDTSKNPVVLGRTNLGNN